MPPRHIAGEQYVSFSLALHDPSVSHSIEDKASENMKVCTMQTIDQFLRGPTWLAWRQNTDVSKNIVHDKPSERNGGIFESYRGNLQVSLEDWQKPTTCLTWLAGRLLDPLYSILTIPTGSFFISLTFVTTEVHCFDSSSA